MKPPVPGPFEVKMKPPVPGPFDGDEPIQIGGFYVWSISKLSPLSK